MDTDGSPRIVGSYLSPYVRKVLVCLHLKGVAYRIDPIVPFYGNEEFTRLSPLRRVPLYIDDQVALSDSTRDLRIPRRAPSRHAAAAARRRATRPRALARGVCRHAARRGLRLAPVQPARHPPLRLGRAARRGDACAHALEHEIPQALDYLETELPADGYVFGAIGRADVALPPSSAMPPLPASSVDAARWPKTQAYVARVLAHPAFERVAAPSRRCRARTPIAAAAQRAAARPVRRSAERSFGTTDAAPRRVCL